MANAKGSILKGLRNRRLVWKAKRLIEDGFVLAETHQALDGTEYVFLVTSDKSRMLRLESPMYDDDPVNVVTINADDVKLFQKHCVAQ